MAASCDSAGPGPGSSKSPRILEAPKSANDAKACFTGASTFVQDTTAAARGTHCDGCFSRHDPAFCPPTIPDIAGTGILTFDRVKNRYIAEDGSEFKVTFATAELQVTDGHQCVYVDGEAPIHLCEDPAKLGRLRAGAPFSDHHIVDGALVNKNTGEVFAEFPVDIAAIVNTAWNGWEAHCVFAFNEEGAVPLADSCEAWAQRVMAELRERSVAHRPARETWLVPSLGAELAARGNAIVDAVVDAKPADYHPGSDDIVNDVLHPSLYPHITDKPSTLGQRAHDNFFTVIPGTDAERQRIQEAHMAAAFGGAPDAASLPKQDIWGRPFRSSISQWLPSDWDVSADGSVTLAPGSHLNAPPVCDALRPLLEAVYTAAVPLLDALLQFVSDSSAQTPAKPVRGSSLQIIPQVQEIVLKPGQSYSQDAMRYTGMGHENIEGTVLYVLRRDEGLEGGAMEFQRAIFANEARDMFMRLPQHPYKPVKAHLKEMLPLGQTELPQGTLLVFPNCHAHRVLPLTNTTDRVLRRRIVVGFLVNPAVPIPSAASVPNLSSSVPLADAARNREALMEERRVVELSVKQRILDRPDDEW